MLQPTVPLGRLAGIRIGAHWSALVTVAVFTGILASVLNGRATISMPAPPTSSTH